MIAANPFPNLLRRPAPYRCRRKLTFGCALAAFKGQLAGQIVRKKEGLLRPATLGQVVDDS
jgi:hypothetical protein